MMRRGRGG